jgi:hypothetical protein
VNYQQQFHVEPLLILDTINWGPAFWPEITWQNFVSLALNHRRTTKEATRAHATAAGTPSSPPPGPCRHRLRQDLIVVTTAAAPVPGPHPCKEH